MTPFGWMIPPDGSPGAIKMLRVDGLTVWYQQGGYYVGDTRYFALTLSEWAAVWRAFMPTPWDEPAFQSILKVAAGKGIMTKLHFAAIQGMSHHDVAVTVGVFVPWRDTFQNAADGPSE